MDKMSISCFFPCYNDAGSIASMVVMMDSVVRKVTDDYEITVIDDGSSDGSRAILNELEAKYDKLRLVFHDKNKGYGGALKAGFYSARKEYIFYTDGDFQYDVRELDKLIPLMREGIDVVNGYKVLRSDPLNRVIIGNIYQYLMKFTFGFKIRDVDCDFRLMRRKIFDGLDLKYNSGIVCVEMIRKLQDKGCRFDEVAVSHYHRVYGRSQFFNFIRLFHVARDLSKLWWELIGSKSLARVKGKGRHND
ncbi:MAG: glycosyltransferase family 2 protein [Candidatus Omnitrophota bacterium]